MRLAVRSGPPSQTPHRPGQVVDQAEQAGPRYAPALRSGRAAALLGVLSQRARVGVDVHHQREREPRPERQQSTRHLEGNAVHVHAQQLVEIDVGVGHQRQGRQEVLAELLVGDPGLLHPLELNDTSSSATMGLFVLTRTVPLARRLRKSLPKTHGSLKVAIFLMMKQKLTVLLC